MIAKVTNAVEILISMFLNIMMHVMYDNVMIVHFGIIHERIMVSMVMCALV